LHPSSPHPLLRPAIFFDRDGTLIVDPGYVYRLEDLVFMPGGAQAVRRVNDLGYFAFLVTNQSGIARGYYTEQDVNLFHNHLQQQLGLIAGAHLDDIRYCPYLADAPVSAYARASDWRKPGPGMLLDLMRAWPVDRERSLVIGDGDVDMGAAKAAGLRGLRFEGGNLDAFLAASLPA
jgi:D-glycero-D-manno-heptose 1,7-bisphosphate phosphatase